MTKGEIDNIVKDIISDVTGNTFEVNDASNLVNDLGIDDFYLTEVIMRVENEFEISVSINEFYKITTFKYLVDLIQEEI